MNSQTVLNLGQAALEVMLMVSGPLYFAGCHANQ